jgi:peptide/nickel transport system substrate-binding protein
MSEETVLREAFDYAFSRLDPTGAHIDPPAVAIYETALVKGPDWQAHPMLADGPEVADDGLEWLVRLRPGLRFHSGAACDAEAVLAAYTHLRCHSFEDRDLWYWDPVDRVEAVDAGTLRFRLHHPYSRLPALLWGTHTAVYNERGRAGDPDGFGYGQADGTGPFRMVSWSPEKVVAEAWRDYQPPAGGFLGTSSAQVDRIEWEFIPGEDDRLAALEAGTVDCLHGPPLGEVDRLKDDPRFVVFEHAQASNFYLALDFRCDQFGFERPAVRRAISAALDRQAIVDVALAGRGTATLGPIPPGDEHYDPGVDVAAGTRAPEAAARALEAEGWAIGDDGVRVHDGQRLSFECLTQDDPVFRRVMEEVVVQLRRIGVEVRPHYELPFAPFYERCGSFPATLSKWLWQDPVDAVIGFSSSSTAPSPNWQHSTCPAVDEAYAAWLRAGSPDELRAAASEVQRRFARELPYIPLATPNDVFACGAHVKGWRPYRANLYPFYQGVTVQR